MTDVTKILQAIEQGDSSAANQLLPVVYDALRQLAAARMSHESPNHTLQATALVHEAYLRLVGSNDQHWDGRGHFFAAAAEAMRRILIDRARSKSSLKRGGDRNRVDIDTAILGVELPQEDLIDFDEALEVLSVEDPEAAKLAKLRCFAGLSIEESADVLGIPERTAYRRWRIARAWLFRKLSESDT